MIGTGANTWFGAVASAGSARHAPSSFDLGVRSVTSVLIRFMLVLVPIVLALKGFTTGNWLEAALFAVSVAVGLTPEMLPAVVTTNLAKGAVFMARRKVIVKRLGAIQDLGAMTVLCTDKTGTLTQDRAELADCFDIWGEPHDDVLAYAQPGQPLLDRPQWRVRHRCRSAPSTPISPSSTNSPSTRIAAPPP